MRYSERAILVVIMISAIWGIRQYVGPRPDNEAMFLAMLPLLLGTAISLAMSKFEFDRTNQVGVQLYQSFWHSGLWSMLRFLNTIFLLLGGLIAMFAVFTV